jgi:hypothetical protein
LEVVLPVVAPTPPPLKSFDSRTIPLEEPEIETKTEDILLKEDNDGYVVSTPGNQRNHAEIPCEEKILDTHSSIETNAPLSSNGRLQDELIKMSLSSGSTPHDQSDSPFTGAANRRHQSRDTHIIHQNQVNHDEKLSSETSKSLNRNSNEVILALSETLPSPQSRDLDLHISYHDIQLQQTTKKVVIACDLGRPIEELGCSTTDELLSMLKCDFEHFKVSHYIPLFPSIHALFE